MAIIAKYEYPNGTVLIDDDCCRDVPEEEMRERIRRLQRTVWELAAKQEVKKHEKDI